MNKCQRQTRPHTQIECHVIFEALSSCTYMCGNLQASDKWAALIKLFEIVCSKHTHGEQKKKHQIGHITQWAATREWLGRCVIKRTKLIKLGTVQCYPHLQRKQLLSLAKSHTCHKVHTSRSFAGSYKSVAYFLAVGVWMRCIPSGWHIQDHHSPWYETVT